MNTKQKTIDALEEFIDALETELKYLQNDLTGFTPEQLLEYIKENALAEFTETIKEVSK